MFKNVVVVSGHPRSGTHLVIDAIRLNIENSDFPLIRPSFSTLENLILPHDNQVLDLWITWLKKCEDKNLIPVIKTHCIPSDIEAFLNVMNNKREADLIFNILKKGKFIYVRRDPLDALKSWYEFAKGGGVVQANASKKRLEEISFGEFLDLENVYKLPFRNWSDIDQNVINFIAYHHLEWKKFIKEKDGIYLNFSDFINKFDVTSQKLFNYLNSNPIDDNSEKISTINYQNPFTKESQNKIYALRIRIINKFIVFLSNIFPNIKNLIKTKSRVPPPKKLNLKIMEKDIFKLDRTYKKAFEEYSNKLF